MNRTGGRTTHRLHVAVEGMADARCATRIGTGLTRVDGVEKVEVGLLPAQATIVFDPGQVTPGELRAEVRALGYAVQTPVGAVTTSTRGRIAVGACLAVIVLLMLLLVAVA